MRSRNSKQLPEDKQIFRYWVEILEVKTGAKRELPLNGVRKIYFPRKKDDPRKPDEDVLQLKDGPETLEARNLDELAAQLCERYPDEAYERRLFEVRDHDAEKRHADAMDGLITILAEAAVESYLRSEEP